MCRVRYASVLDGLETDVFESESITVFSRSQGWLTVGFNGQTRSEHSDQ